MSVGEGAGVGFATMRGRSYPALRQFTVFLENRVGQLMEVIRRFEGSRVRICALSINDATECAFVRFLLSNPEQGREILERAGLPGSALKLEITESVLMENKENVVTKLRGINNLGVMLALDDFGTGYSSLIHSP